MYWYGLLVTVAHRTDILEAKPCKQRQTILRSEAEFVTTCQASANCVSLYIGDPYRSSKCLQHYVE